MQVRAAISSRAISRRVCTAHAPAPPQPEAFAAVIPDSPLVFDTYRMVTLLERHGGFGKEQSEALANAMARVSQASTRYANSNLVTKSEFVSLRSELSILEKSDFALLKADISVIEKKADRAVAEVYTSLERAENRIVKWAVALAGAAVFGILRIAPVLSPSQQRAPPPTSVHSASVSRSAGCKPETRILHV